MRGGRRRSVDVDIDVDHRFAGRLKKGMLLFFSSFLPPKIRRIHPCQLTGTRSRSSMPCLALLSAPRSSPTSQPRPARAASTASASSRGDSILR
jgi:hypothetical protein